MTNTLLPDTGATELAQSLGLAQAEWTPLGGGRSNKIWKVTEPGKAPIVCKLFAPEEGNALFPNDPAAEVLALRALSGTSIAPSLISVDEFEGQIALTYAFVDGSVGPSATEDVGELLARLHASEPPKGLRQITSGPEAILASARSFADRLQDKSALPSAPTPIEVGPASAVFLHGDPVPANMVCEPEGLCLIDWQCPALGDPHEDIFVFLSPAMQSLYGGRVLGKDDVAAFFAGYGAQHHRRYRSLAPFFHWRMAAYCLWKAEQGAKDYRAAATLEIDALETLIR